MPSPRFSTVRYLRTNAATPLSCSQRATLEPSRSIASATNPPPGAMMTLAPVAFVFFGRNAVSVGVTTFMMTVPTGVFSIVVSVCVQRSEPGATRGQMFSVCARTRHDASAMPAAVKTALPLPPFPPILPFLPFPPLFCRGGRGRLGKPRRVDRHVHLDLGQRDIFLPVEPRDLQMEGDLDAVDVAVIGIIDLRRQSADA